jgi:hypothetical protein
MDERLLNALNESGGKLSNGKLREKLRMIDVEYEQVINEAINNGEVKIGRGRGGVIILVSEAERQAQENFPKKEKATKNPKKKDSILDTLAVGEENYVPVPNDVNEFKPGMYVVRPPSYLTDEEAWNNLRHYVVVSTDESSVYLRDRFNHTASVIKNVPEGFYIAK